MAKSLFIENLIKTLQTDASNDLKKVEIKIKSEIPILKADVKSVLSTFEKDVITEVDAAKASIESEITKLKTAIKTKLASIEAHNKEIATLQGLVLSLENGVKDAAALVEKLAAVVEGEAKSPSTTTTTITPVATTTTTVS